MNEFVLLIIIEKQLGFKKVCERVDMHYLTHDFSSKQCLLIQNNYIGRSGSVSAS